MHVIVPPVVVADRICRIVAPLPSLLEVEEWMGEWWEPCMLTFREVGAAPPATARLLEQRGVPRDEWGLQGERASMERIDALLLANVVVRPPSAGTPHVEGAHGRRQKAYPGSARFGRAKRTPKRPSPGADAVIRLGPRRRRSDPGPEAGPTRPE